MACEAVKEQGTDVARAHWMKIAERAWRDFEEDRNVALGTAGDRLI